MSGISDISTLIRNGDEERVVLLPDEVAPWDMGDTLRPRCEPC